MSWNNRVIKHTKAHPDGTVEAFFTIHEVYYDGDVPHSITQAPVPGGGETLEELRESLELMLKACDKPVLNYEDF